MLNKPGVIIPQVNTKIDAATGELTDPATRGFIADQLKAFAGFVRGKSDLRRMRLQERMDRIVIKITEI